MERAELLTPIQEERKPVAFHEFSHGFVGKFYGLIRNFMTVVPDGNNLGVTSLSANPYNSESKNLMAFIAAGTASEIGEEIMGITDHSGCGSDRFMQRLYSMFYIIKYDAGRTIDSVLTEGRSMARHALNTLGYDGIFEGGTRLAIAGSL